MAKPQPRRVPSDDCEVTVDGEVYRPHEGESVWVFPGLSVQTLTTLNAFARIQVEIDAAKGDVDETQQTLAILEKHLDRACQVLASRIDHWDWTDLRNQQMPQPNGNPDAIKQLESEEVVWLIQAMKGETPSQRKNA